MESTSPKTPGRGRSRFSKALPTPPASRAKSPPSLHSPLPPLPKEKMSTTIAILRRPVGGGQTNNSKTISIASVSSVYSDSPGLSRSISDSSNITKDSLSAVSETPPLPPKDSQRQFGTPKTPNILGSPLLNSPPRPEIWRRRSVKSDRSISFPELKLEKSNGSTASPPSRKERPPERSLPAIPNQLPRSIAGRKPVPARPAPAQPMGNKIAKLKDKLESKDEAPYPSPKQLPTPEYLKTDKQPLTPQVLSPVSPETPPEDPPQVPQKSDSRPNLLTTHSRDTSETLTITSEPVVMRSPQPQKAYVARILTPQPSPPPASPPPPINFPGLPPAAEGTIFPGPALDIVHLECYQSHKFMRSSRNTMCPVACMICQNKDVEMRWKCTWCCLSACGACMQVLASIPGKDLRICLERIGG